MRAAAPVALTGLLGLILLEILKIILEPVAAWLLGVLLAALKIGLSLLAAVVGLAFVVFGVAVTIFVVRRLMRDREEMV